jgi:hypothetical protein
MNLILQSIVPVIERARDVRIGQEGLDAFCGSFKGLDSSSFKAPFKSPSMSPEDKIRLDFAYNSANFCYWQEPRWTVEYKGREIKGAFGMKAAFYRGIEEGYPLTDASFLTKISLQDFERIVRGRNNLQLLTERINHLHEVGMVLTNQYGGDVINVVEKGKGDAIKLLEEITGNFSCYDDSGDYFGERVFFHKRAQLVVSNIDKTLRTAGRTGLQRVDELTALADYKVPQILRHLGIIAYSKGLSQIVDNKGIIVAGSPDEVEIRAFTIESVERMVGKLKRNFPDVNAIELDKYLYHESKVVKEEMRPHHRAISTAH